MLRILFFGLLFATLGRLFSRLFGLRSRPRVDRPSPPTPKPADEEALRDLTQQEISDADFEEIPPEE